MAQLCTTAAGHKGMLSAMQPMLRHMHGPFLFFDLHVTDAISNLDVVDSVLSTASSLFLQVFGQVKSSSCSVTRQNKRSPRKCRELQSQPQCGMPAGLSGGNGGDFS